MVARRYDGPGDGGRILTGHDRCRPSGGLPTFIDMQAHPPVLLTGLFGAETGARVAVFGVFRAQAIDEEAEARGEDANFKEST